MLKDNGVPIFIQIKEKIKDDILTGVYAPHELIISTTQISRLYSVNPATAVKSVSLLNEEGIVYKKRGIGMCVQAGAREIIREERTNAFFKTSVVSLINEAKMLGIEREQLIQTILEAEEYD